MCLWWQRRSGLWGLWQTFCEKGSCKRGSSRSTVEWPYWEQRILVRLQKKIIYHLLSRRWVGSMQDTCEESQGDRTDGRTFPFSDLSMCEHLHRFCGVCCAWQPTSHTWVLPCLSFSFLSWEMSCNCESPSPVIQERRLDSMHRDLHSNMTQVPLPCPQKSEGTSN